MKSVGRWIKALGAGLLAGLIAALFMTVVMALLRLFLGIPLPSELGADRYLPTLSVYDFLSLTGQFGGPSESKTIALLSVFGGQVAVGAVVGVLYAAIVERDRVGNPEQVRRFGISRGGVIFMVVALVVIWVAFLAVLWPVLGANNRGLTPGLASVATALGLLVSFASFGAALVLVYRLMTSREPLRQPAPVGRPVGRRAFLAGAGALVLAAASGGLIRRLYDVSTIPYDGTTYSGAGVQPITPNDQFYVVTKNIIDPSPNKAPWRLRMYGQVDNPRTYGFEDLAALPSVDQEMTLECISNGIGGGLMSNAMWRGTPLRNLIEDAGPSSGVVQVFFHAADGYTHTASIEKAMEDTTLVAYEMNGEPLPERHGYPARILVPGYYGEGSVKWVTGIELVDDAGLEGYYGKQGWKPRYVYTGSRIDQPQDGQSLSSSQSTIKGVAFAGDRGISKVEVSTDGGGSWQDANIDYKGTNLTWVLWSYDWQPGGSGEYQLIARATDGNGDLQPEGDSTGVADGKSGYHMITAQVTA